MDRGRKEMLIDFDVSFRDKNGWRNLFSLPVYFSLKGAN